MQNWIGNKPTLTQKSLNSKYERLLQHAFYSLIPNEETILKVIEAECDKKSGREINGVLALTNSHLYFVSKNENFSINYDQISDVDVKTDGKDKKEWQLTLAVGRSKRFFDDIKKDDDSQEFFDILEKKIINPSQFILTTVTHNFNYFLHAEKLEELKKNNVQITSFLMKRDDMGFSKNGERLLKEKHPNAKLIIEATYHDKEKKGNFIVVDKFVLLYEYKDKERKAKKIVAWPFTFFTGALADHYALKTEIITSEGKLVLKNSGKKFVSELSKHNIEFSTKIRKWYNKILGYRSRKWWKMTIASISYAFFLLIAMIIIFVDETETVNTNKETNTVATASTTKENDNKINSQDKEKMLAEEKRKQEEAARLAEEKRKQEEAARLAEEKRKQEEAARLAEEKRKQEEAARLAEEKRKQEEAASLAEENRKKEEAAASVYYKNCDAARDAGAAPVHRGEPGYGKHLDRDGDGTGCDS
jgi:Excalibur calcium-binding domain